MDPFTAPNFEPVAAAFDALVQSRPGWSGSLCAYVDGVPVVDVWGGPAYHGTNLQAVYSCTKGIGAACCALLMQRGLLDPDAPVARYWPEFAAAGKEHVTVRVLLSHQAGLTAVQGGFGMAEYIEHDALAARLAAQAPYWEPGTGHGYHSLLMGTIFRELVRRVDGRSTRAFYDEEIRLPYDIDFTIGLPAERRDRVTPHRFLLDPTKLPADMAAKMAEWNQRPIPKAANENRTIPLFESPYLPESQDADLPAVNGFASARGLARFYATLTTGVDGGAPLLDPATIAAVGEVQCDGPDLNLPVDMCFGLGFMTPIPGRMEFGDPGTFGHDGAAGSLGFANPRRRLGFGFVSDTAMTMGADPAAVSLAATIVACIGA